MQAKKQTDLPPRAAGPRSLFEEFDRIFDSFRTGLERMFEEPTFTTLDAWTPSGVGIPVVDLVDAGGEFVVTAEMPGTTMDDLDIEVNDESAEIQARVQSETKREDDGMYVHERAYNRWYRRVPFSAWVLPDRARATLKDGVLTLRAPKAEPMAEKKARKVPVE